METSKDAARHCLLPDLTMPPSGRSLFAFDGAPPPSRDVAATAPPARDERRGGANDVANVTQSTEPPSTERNLPLRLASISFIPPPLPLPLSRSDACLRFKASTASFNLTILWAYRSPTANAVFLSLPARLVVYASTRPCIARHELEGPDDRWP